MLGEMGYQQLKEELLSHFKQEGLMHVRALQRIKQQGDKLEEYNTEFAQKAAAASGLMHDIQVKDVYVAGLSNIKMREQLAAHLEKPLPVLQAKAMDLAHVYAQNQGVQARGNNKSTHQNPNRV